MSAPWEVFVSWGGGSKQGDGLAMPKDSLVARDLNVRYLRTNLTCGECELYCKNDCSHMMEIEPPADDPNEIMRQVWKGSTAPACMSFIPKVRS